MIDVCTDQIQLYRLEQLLERYSPEEGQMLSGLTPDSLINSYSARGLIDDGTQNLLL